MKLATASAKALGYVLAALGVACTSVPTDGAPPGSGGSGSGGSGSSSGSHTSGGSGSGGTMSPFQPMPDNGGPVLVQPDVVTMVFDDDPDAQTMLDFVDWAVTGSWLATVGADYGIGSGSNQHINMSTVNATVTDSDVQSWLTANITSGALPAPGDPTAPTLYVWLLGPGALMTSSDGSCVGGYHSEMTIGSQQVPYAVVPTCASDTYLNLTSLQYREGRASHELIEAFTDPLPDSAPSYIFDDPDQVWTSAYGEVGDLCVWNYLPFESATNETFYAQRIWSNTAAALGGDPCVPRPPSLAYFNVTATPAYATASPGDTVTFTLTGWTAEAPHAAWPIWTGPSAWADFDASPGLSTGMIANGGQATVTMQVPVTAISGQRASLTIISDDGMTNSIWPVAVEVQ